MNVCFKLHGSELKSFEIFQLGPKWCTDRPTDITIPSADKKSVNLKTINWLLATIIINIIPIFTTFEFLTCDIQGDWGANGGVFPQVAGESGTIVFIDDGCDTDAAVTQLIFLLQTDDGTIPQPDQLFISLRVVAAVRLTNQRHGLFQLCLYNTIDADVCA